MAVKLGDICNKIGSGFTPTGGSNVYVDSGVALVRSQNVLNMAFSTDGLAFINESIASAMDNVSLCENDILLNITGDSVARVCLVPKEILPARVNQHVCIIRVDDKKANPQFVYYQLYGLQKNLLSLASVGATRKALTKQMIEDLEIELPVRQLQDNIVAIMSNIQSKIDVNKTINDNLSEQGQAIFNELILNGEAASEERLADIAHFQNGLPMQKNRPIAGEGLPVLKIKELGQGRCDDSSERCRDDIDHSVLINNGDVVFSWSGSLMAKIWCGGKCGLNQHLFKVTSEKYPLWFYYYWLQYHMPDFIDIAANKATTMGHICRNHLDDAIVSIPHPEIMKKADSVLSLIINAQIKSMEEITQLTVLRDYLLPKLMSGEIDVSTLEIPN